MTTSRPEIGRRRFLANSALATASIAAPTFSLLPERLAAAQAKSASKRSLILVWLDGGLSHLDTFDGKPDASGEIRGELVTKESSVEGVFVSEHLPKLSKRMKDCCLIRSLTSGEGNHDRGSHYMLTGHRPSPVLTYPSFGALLSGPTNASDAKTPSSSVAVAGLPTYVAVPTSPPYGHHGFLPRTHGPFEIESDPSKGNFRVKNLAPRADSERRLELLERLDKLDGTPRSRDELARDDFLERALALSLEPRAREVFDVSKEPPESRKRYGRHRLGQSCLLARRLVESGARTVLVRDQGWDHHQTIKTRMTYGFPPKLPALDESISALIDDLERRGLSERVLVVVASEFGRTPRINPAGGRDHWPRAHSALLFGAGLRRGTVIGKTDVRGEEPIERPVSPADFFATALAALDVDLETVSHTSDGRPVRLVEEGARPIRDALATRKA